MGMRIMMMLMMIMMMMMMVRRMRMMIICEVRPNTHHSYNFHRPVHV